MCAPISPCCSPRSHWSRRFGYFVQRWTLLYSGEGVVQGATYTDIKARLPAINLLLFASLVAVVLLLVNVRRRGWTYPAVAVGLWLVLSVVVGVDLPGAGAEPARQPAGERQGKAVHRTQHRGHARRPSVSAESTCRRTATRRPCHPRRSHRTRTRSATSGCGIRSSPPTPTRASSRSRATTPSTTSTPTATSSTARRPRCSPRRASSTPQGCRTTAGRGSIATSSTRTVTGLWWRRRTRRRPTAIRSSR